MFSADGKRVVFNTGLKKIAVFPWYLKHLSHKANPEESQDVRDILFPRCFLEGRHHNQDRLYIRRKALEFKDMTGDRALERALHLEAVKIKEEEEQLPQIAVLKHDDPNKSLVGAVNRLVQKFSIAISRKMEISAHAGINNFIQNQGRPNLVEMEKMD